MKEIIVPKPKDDSLPAQLLALYETFKNFSSREDLNFNLSKLDWASPLLILPISAYINNTKSTFTPNPLNSVKSYLGTVNFPTGVDSIPALQEHKSFIPICVLKRGSGSEREKLQTVFEKMVYKTLQGVEGAQSAIYYPITELVTNIFEHSKMDTGYIFGQFYPAKHFLDICIVDCGRGLANSYKEEQKLNLSDEEAITEAMKGHSTKPELDRGYGMRTSKQMVCNGLNGSFVLVSGKSALISTSKSEKLVSLPNFYWQGTMIAYRIPKPEQPIDITPYLE